MTKTRTKSPAMRIRVSIIANHLLVRESLECLIEKNDDLKVVAISSFNSFSDGSAKPGAADIAVIYFESGDSLEIIKSARIFDPNTRIVVITDGEDLECSTKALKFGAVGIVRADQSSKLLIEAIRRAFKGETWLNQTLLTNLLKSGENANGSKVAGKNGPAPETITPREVQVIAMIGKGLKSKVIADRLSISEATVRHHLSSIYGKLGVDDRLNLVIYAFENGLISLSDRSPGD